MDFDFVADGLHLKKLSQADDMCNPLTFTRITSETASAMELEFLNTELFPENLPHSPNRKSEVLENYSKDSLKFARRISKSFLQFIKQDKDVMVRTFLACGNTMLSNQASILGVDIIDTNKLMKDSLQLIRDIWNYFTKNLSCSYNKKISKVPKDIWDIVFTEEGFWKAAIELGSSLQIRDYFSGCGEVEAEIIRGYYKKILFLVNRGMIMVHLHSEKAAKEDFSENISKFDNYMVLSMAPELFDAYNHKRGVFVDECCRACKVCQSKLADKTIPSKIKTAWDYAIAFEKSFKSNTFQGFQDALNILQFLTILDDDLASFSRL